MADVAIMERSRLVAGLVEMKRELVAKHADLLAQLNETAKDINAVSRVLSKCDADEAYIPVFPPRKYRAFFASGELLALIAEALKAMPGGATLKEISNRIESKQAQAERELPKKLEYSVKEALERMLKRGAVVKSKRPDNHVIWLLAKRGAVQDQAAEANPEQPAPSGNVTPLRR